MTVRDFLFLQARVVVVQHPQGSEVVLMILCDKESVVIIIVPPGSKTFPTMVCEVLNTVW